jgi:hypothetical protein
MKRIFAKPLFAAALAVLIDGAVLSRAATAYPIDQWEELQPDYSVTTIYYDPVTRLEWAVNVSREGKLTAIFIISNPNPEDNTTGKGSHADKPDVVKLIKDGDVTYQVHVAPADVPQLIAHLEGKLGFGGGLGPHYNPSDDDNGNGPGPAPEHSMEVKKTPDEIRQEIRVANEVAQALATLGSAMGDGDEGGGESFAGFNKNSGAGDPGNDDGDYTEGQDKTVGKTEKDLLGAKPDVVNPPHWGSNTATHGDNRASSRGAAGGGSGKAGGGSLGGSAHSAMNSRG